MNNTDVVISLGQISKEDLLNKHLTYLLGLFTCASLCREILASCVPNREVGK